MRYAPVQASDRVSARYVPPGASEVKDDAAGATVYTYTTARGVASAIGYAGTAYRPAFHHSFRSEEARSVFLARWLQSQLARAAARRDRQETKAAAVHSLVVGDIVYSSWGYEQTNIDFFQVVEVVSAKSVRLRRIRQSTDETGFMSGQTRGIKDEFLKDAELLLCRAEGDHIRNVGGRYKRAASKWDGRDLYCSWYA